MILPEGSTNAYMTYTDYAYHQKQRQYHWTDYTSPSAPREPLQTSIFLPYDQSLQTLTSFSSLSTLLTALSPDALFEHLVHIFQRKEPELVRQAIERILFISSKDRERNIVGKGFGATELLTKSYRMNHYECGVFITPHLIETLYRCSYLGFFPMSN